MKIKVKPEDFIVREKLKISFSSDGPYEVWLLKKRGTTTLDVISDISKKNRIKLSDISYCGLKDRHSLSFQFISAPKGAIKKTRGVNYELIPSGYLHRQVLPSDLLYNEFDVVVRDVALPEDIVLKEIEHLNRYGLVNYYDEQRLGSARHKKGFVAEEIVKKEYKKALKLLIATPSKWDSGKIKRFRRCLEENWGKWIPCLSLAVFEWEKRILNFLVGREFSKSTAKKALSMVDPNIMQLCFNAYQAFIWNETAAKLLLRYFAEDELIKVPYIYGKFYFYRDIEDDLLNKLSFIEIPTISPKLKLKGLLRDVIQEVLSERGINSLDELRSHIRGAIFRSHKRPFIVRTEIFYEVEEDEMYVGKKKWRLKFHLPSGSYATLVIKRIFHKEM